MRQQVKRRADTGLHRWAGSVAPIQAKAQKAQGLDGQGLRPAIARHSLGNIAVDEKAGNSESFAPTPSRTGLPNRIKHGVENLSGVSLDDVTVHYNSPRPAGVQALAYAQGTEIHVGPGHERHLPHEAWYVVQQKQGRVSPTVQSGGVSINDDPALEKEADALPGRQGSAAAIPPVHAAGGLSPGHSPIGTTIAAPGAQLRTRVPRSPVQRVRMVGNPDEPWNNQFPHLACGSFYESGTEFNRETKWSPLIIEVLEPDIEAARTKIRQPGIRKLATIAPVAFVVGLNSRLNPGQDVNAQLQELAVGCNQLAEEMEDAGFLGGCIPIVWRSTSETAGGYTFPYMEARSILTLHPGLKDMHDEMGRFDVPVVRSMDSDVQNDPLLDPQRQDVKNLAAAFKYLTENPYAIFSGGYEWAADDVEEAGFADLNIPPVQGLENFLKDIIGIVNKQEHAVREKLVQTSHKAQYWPEPNTYMSLELRREGAKKSADAARGLGNRAQQRESTYYISSVEGGSYQKELSTTKPLKRYFDDFLKYFAGAYTTASDPSRIKEEVREQVKEIRQTHLNIENVDRILGWHSEESTALLDAVTPIVNDQLEKCVDAIVEELKVAAQRRRGGLEAVA